jgi:hypothetical protein
MCYPPTAAECARVAAEHAKQNAIAAKFSRVRKGTFSYPGGYPRPQFFTPEARASREEKWNDKSEMESAMSAAGPTSCSDLAAWAACFSTDELRAEAVEMFCTQVYDLADDQAIETLASAVQNKAQRDALRQSLKKDLPLLVEFWDTIKGYSEEAKKRWRESDRARAAAK